MVSVLVLMAVVAGIIAIGFFSNLFFSETQIPDLIWLMLVGVLIGPVLNILPRDTLMSISPLFAAVALLIILFDRGLEMNLSHLLVSTPGATFLTLTSFAIAIIFVALPSYAFFGLGWFNAILLGTIVAGTSSPMVLTVLDKVEGMGADAKQLLNIESIISDPLVIVLALVMMQGASGQAGLLTPAYITTTVVGMFAVSIILGLGIGLAWSHVLVGLKKYEYHHMLTLAVLFFAYPLAEFLGGSGAIISLTIGIVLANTGRFLNILKGTKLEGLSDKTKEFNDHLSFFVRTFFFVFLGAMINLGRPLLLWAGVVLTLFLLLARALTVKVVSHFMELGTKDRIMMTFMFPKGLASAVVASLPFVQYSIAGTEVFTDIVFAIIFSSSVLATAGLASADKIYEIEEEIEEEIEVEMEGEEEME